MTSSNHEDSDANELMAKRGRKKKKAALDSFLRNPSLTKMKRKGLEKIILDCSDVRDFETL